MSVCDVMHTCTVVSARAFLSPSTTSGTTQNNFTTSHSLSMCGVYQYTHNHASDCLTVGASKLLKVTSKKSDSGVPILLRRPLLSDFFGVTLRSLEVSKELRNRVRRGEIVLKSLYYILPILGPRGM